MAFPAKNKTTRTRIYDDISKTCNKLDDEGVKFNKASWFNSNITTSKNGREYKLDDDESVKDLLREQNKWDDQFSGVLVKQAASENSSKARVERERLENAQRPTMPQQTQMSAPEITKESFRRGPAVGTDGASYWTKCANYNDVGCVPKENLREWDRISGWGTCFDPTKNGCIEASKLKTRNGMTITEIEGGGKKSRRKKRKNRKTKKYNIKK